MRTVQFINPCLKIKNDLQVHQNFILFMWIQGALHDYSDLRPLTFLQKKVCKRNEG